MIDYQNEIFTTVATTVRSMHTGAVVIGEYTRSPSQFPAVTLDEIENVTVPALIDSSDEERYCGVTYRLQVFSNKTAGKKVMKIKHFAFLLNLSHIPFGIVAFLGISRNGIKSPMNKNSEFGIAEPFRNRTFVE